MIEKISNVITKISKEQKIAFFTTIVVGVLVHLYMITNKFPQHDDLNQLYALMHRPESGRWFLAVPASWSGNMSIPFGGILAIVYIAIGAMLVVEMLNIKSEICVALISAIMVTFPTVSCSMSYMNCVDAYYFAMLLCCIGVYLTSRKKRYLPFAVICFTLALAIYQCYFAFAIVLIVLIHIGKTFSCQHRVKDVWLSGIKYILILICSIISYLGIMEFQKMSGLELGSYQGANEMGLSITGIKDAYLNSINYYLMNSKEMHYSYLSVLFIIVWGVTIAGIIWLIYSQRKKGKVFAKVILICFLLGMLPFAAGVVYMLDAKVHIVMIYSFIGFLILPIQIMDIISENKKDVKKEENKKVSKCFVWLAELMVIGTSFLTVFCYSIRANQYYLALSMVYEQSYAYSVSLMSDIMELENYTEDAEILLTGQREVVWKEIAPWRAGEENLYTMTGLDKSYTNTYSYGEFLKYYLGMRNEITILHSQDDVEGVMDIVEWEKMNIYPNEESIVMDGDKIIIKMGELK